MEEIPFQAGCLKRNLLLQRSFVKRKPGGEWLTVEAWAASTADSYVPGGAMNRAVARFTSSASTELGRSQEKRHSGEWRSQRRRGRRGVPLGAAHAYPLLLKRRPGRLEERPQAG